MKALLFLVLISAMAKIVMTRNASWGNRVPNDKVIFNKTIIAFPKFGEYQNRNIKYDHLLFRKVISAIYVKDNFRNASGAQVDLVNGGIGMKYDTVVIRFQSQYSQGINTTVLIYGK